MNSTKIKTDECIDTLINDYIEGIMSPDKQKGFEKYLMKDKSMASFVQRSLEGKRLASKFSSVQAADHFDKRLQNRISGMCKA